MTVLNESRYQLTIPVVDALAFALGECDLGYIAPEQGLRAVVGALAVDSIEYSEQWRAAALARAALAEKWPDHFAGDLTTSN